MSKRSISIVIPVLNEARHLPATLSSCRHPAVREVLVVDGGSTDNTVRVAALEGARILEGPPGRGPQMNRGAEAARGSILLFLHADTRLPQEFGGMVLRILQTPGTSAGAFRLGISDRAKVYRLIEKAVDLRSRWLSFPYGDQALFVNRERFEEVGRFPDSPIFEDVALVRRLRRCGRIRIAPAKVWTSSRRWRRTGVVRLTLIHQIVLTGYLLGIEPGRISALYNTLTGRSASVAEKSAGGVETFGQPPAS